MTVLVDVNVVLDVLLDRKPHVNASSAVWTAIETRRAKGLLAAHAVITIHSIAKKQRGAKFALRTVRALLQVFGVAAVDSNVIQRALLLPPDNFEDSVTAAAAEVAKCDAIVTRDPRGFAGSPVRAITPESAQALLSKR